MKLFLTTSLLLTLSTSICAQEYGYGDGSILMEPASNENTNPNGYRTYAFISTTHPVEYIEAIIPFAYGYDNVDIRVGAQLEWEVISPEEITNSGYMIEGFEFYVGPTIEEDANSWDGYKFRVNSSTKEGELDWCGYGVPVLYIYISYYTTDNIYSDFIQTTGCVQYYK
ncbi:MAG: hypothetical protein LUD00_06025 [Prevotellaceae bacterium]|nr:hypothetical protein [Prevotellaceae bacterium]